MDWWLSRDWAETAALVSIIVSITAVYIAWRQNNISRQTSQEGIDASRQIAQDGIDASRQIAQEFGDLAGQQAAIRYEEEKDARARIIALQALLNEVKRIRKAVDHNTALKQVVNPQAIIQLPTIALEIAFFSQEHTLLTTTPADLDKTPSLLTHTLDYLAIADTVNSLINFYPAGHTNDRPQIAGKIRDASKNIPAILDQLEESLKDELAKKSP